MNKCIQAAIEECGSQIELAKLCGVNQTAVWLWLNGGGISARYLPSIVSAGRGRFSYEDICYELAELAKNNTRK